MPFHVRVVGKGRRQETWSLVVQALGVLRARVLLAELSQEHGGVAARRQRELHAKRLEDLTLAAIVPIRTTRVAPIRWRLCRCLGGRSRLPAAFAALLRRKEALQPPARPAQPSKLDSWSLISPK